MTIPEPHVSLGVALPHTGQVRTQFYGTIALTVQENFHEFYCSSCHFGADSCRKDGIFTVDYDYRILFEFVNPDSGEEEIYLLTMGTDNEVY